AAREKIFIARPGVGALITVAGLICSEYLIGHDQRYCYRRKILSSGGEIKTARPFSGHGSRTCVDVALDLVRLNTDVLAVAAGQLDNARRPVLKMERQFLLETGETFHLSRKCCLFAAAKI